MADVIQLLPDAIANQIAAGEVIQRPASVVKELMENSIDAGATKVQLIVKAAGKTLIQVIDNGCGMSNTDARMCFERHATSKIRSAQDLFAIRTMGFRGEAMASIAAIAHVEMHSRQNKNELGTKIVIEGSTVKSQEPCQWAQGTSIAVKNLFYNVPARRKFLKSDAVEMRHIIEEFQRIALANEDIFFTLHKDGKEIFHLPSGNVRQRIVNLFGQATNKKLVPIKEETEVVSINGFLGKPEFAKKTKGEQYFFVNNRFIKSGYLHHAITAAYEELLPKDHHPMYVIYLDIHPDRIDINVHPTKQEIKFDDERLIYNYLRVTARHALGKNSITPSLDFERPPINFDTSYLKTNTKNKVQLENNPLPKNSGHTGPRIPRNQSPLDASNLKNWEKLYDGLDAFDSADSTTAPQEDETQTHITIKSKWDNQTSLGNEEGSFKESSRRPYQMHYHYIVSQIKSGIMIVDQWAAHERIFYERFLNKMGNNTVATQQLLFPKTVELSAADIHVFKNMDTELKAMGFDMNIQDTAILINGLPADLQADEQIDKLMETLLEQFRQDLDLDLGTKEKIALNLAKQASRRQQKKLSGLEMQSLIDQLFACELPYKTPSGKNCFFTMDLEEIESRLR